MRDRLHPPKGIDAELAGLPVLAAEANAAVASPWRRLGTLLAGLAAVALVLFAPSAAWQRALRPAAADRPGHRLVGARPLRHAHPAEPDVGRPRRARDRDLHRVQRAALRALPRRARRGPRARRGAAAHLPVDRRRRAGLGHHGDRGLRRARRLGHQDAARLRLRDGRRPHRRAARRHGRAAGGAAAGRAGTAAPGVAAARGCARSAPRRGEREPGATAWFVAVVGVALIAYVSLNTLRTRQRRLAGPRGRHQGAALRRAAGARPDRGRRQRRAQGQPGLGRQAAGLHRARRRRSSTRASSAERGPFVLAFLATRGAQCTRELDRLARVGAAPSRACRSPPSPIRGDRDDLRALVRRHRWRFPVGLGPRRHPGQPARRRGLPAAHLRAARRAWCRARASASSTTRGSTGASSRSSARGGGCASRERRGPRPRGGLGRPRARARVPRAAARVGRGSGARARATPERAARAPGAAGRPLPRRRGR